MKITTRCGAEAVAQLNDVLLAQPAETKLARMHKVRTDTTVSRPTWRTRPTRGC
ncbi:MAG: hypothetical protein KG028_01915 [Actinobacteria bacterium]|nr:hypothetical protein [Actinomycetota bacterium]